VYIFLVLKVLLSVLNISVTVRKCKSENTTFVYLVCWLCIPWYIFLIFKMLLRSHICMLFEIVVYFK